MAVGLKQEGVALDGAENLAATGEAQLAVEFAGVVEAEDMVRLLGQDSLVLVRNRKVASRSTIASK